MEWAWIVAVLICHPHTECQWLHETRPAFKTKEECMDFIRPPQGHDRTRSCVQYPVDMTSRAHTTTHVYVPPTGTLPPLPPDR